MEILRRTTCDLSVFCKPISQIDGWGGNIIEMSPTEIRLQLMRRFEKNTKLVLSVKNGPTIIIIVFHVESQHDNWLHDCNIISMVAAVEMNSIVISNKVKLNISSDQQKTEIQRALEIVKNKRKECLMNQSTFITIT